MVPLLTAFWPPWPIAIYYDERTLTGPLQESTERSIRTFLPSLVAQESQRLGEKRFLTISSVEQVSKSARDEMYHLEHDGIWLADAMARVTRAYPQESFGPNFLFRDHTHIAVGIERKKAEAEEYNPTLNRTDTAPSRGPAG